MKANREPRLVSEYVKDVARCVPTQSLQEVHNRVVEPTEPSFDVCAVVDEHDRLLGVLGSERLEFDSEKRVQSAMTAPSHTVRADASVADTLEYMRAQGLDWVLVTTPDGRLVGIFERDDAESGAG